MADSRSLVPRPSRLSSFTRLDAAEGEMGASHRFGVGDSLSLVLLGFALDVKAQLVGELALDLAAPNERAGAIEEVIPPLGEHGSPLPSCFYRGKISSRLVEVQEERWRASAEIGGSGPRCCKVSKSLSRREPSPPAAAARQRPRVGGAATSRRAAPPATQSSPRPRS